MPDLWMDVDVALSEVPVNIMSLLDDTDFKTREAAVAYNAAGMDLVWNFVTTAGAFTQTAVTPTTAGVHDWTNQGDGMYTLEIPDTGGTINNDTEGFGWFTGFVTGVLPWRGPVIGFRAAALNNSLIDAGTTGLLAPTVAARTLDVTAAGEAGIDLDNTSGTLTVGEIPNLDAAMSTRATPAQVNTEVLDVLNTDTFGEPGQEAPPATTTLVKKIGYLYKAFRNRITQTATTLSLFADDASTVDQKSTVSDNGTTYDRGELASGP